MRRGGMARIIVVSRRRRGASVVRRRRGICVRARGGVSLVSGSGAGGCDGGQIGWIGVVKPRGGAAAVSLDIKTLDRTSLFHRRGMVALPDRACLMQGAAGHHPWGVVRSDSTSLGAAAGWFRDLAAAVEEVVAVHGHHRGLVVHRGQVLVHFVQVVDEGRRCAPARTLGFAKIPE
jgi:hypothetical protein